ncbi:MAG TPA: PQQ-binding-like beta-propeller repeat protein [Candidatus Acidoferrales bacterium]|nr:PQQ-binding-like beta-propeller repeat protein [Candidatus Acidoferrales bacterium]
MRSAKSILCTALAVSGILLVSCALAPGSSAQAAPDGAALFTEHCAACHQDAPAGDGRPPTRAVLAQESREEIVRAMESGPMIIYGGGLTSAERRAVAAFLSSNTASTAEMSQANPCKSVKPIAAGSLLGVPHWNGWGVDTLNTRFQTHTGIRSDSLSRLKLKWAFGVPDESTAYGQPTVVGGRVFIGSGDGTVYALDAGTGCTIWTYRAEATVRTAITVGSSAARGYLAYFGDGEANLYAVDAGKGTLVWKVKVDPHRFARITGAPTLFRGRLYVPLAASEELTGGDPNYPCCTFRGNVAAVDALTGKQIWKGYAITEAPGPSKPGASHAKFSPAGAGIWDSPTIDEKRGELYVGTGDAYVDPAADGTDAVIAFDLKTGKRLWAQQKTPGDVFNFGCIESPRINCPAQIGPDVDFGSSPILQDLGNGHRVLMAGQKSGVMYGLDPDGGGKTLWETRVGRGGGLGGIEWGSATDGANVYVAISDISTLVPSGPPGSTPPPVGGLAAIDIRTGKLLWKTMPPKPECEGRSGCSAGQLAAVTVVPGVVFSGSMDGHLRAYSTKDGSILWDFDTLPDFTTVNGVKAHGGSMSGSGPVVAGDMLYVASGFSGTAGMPGNVVLAFEESAGSSAAAH